MNDSDMPTKPSVMTLPDYHARVAAYRAVQDREIGSLDGPVTTWDTVCLIVDAYNEAKGDQQKREREMYQHELQMREWGHD